MSRRKLVIKNNTVNHIFRALTSRRTWQKINSAWGLMPFHVSIYMSFVCNYCLNTIHSANRIQLSLLHAQFGLPHKWFIAQLNLIVTFTCNSEEYLNTNGTQPLLEYWSNQYSMMQFSKDPLTNSQKTGPTFPVTREKTFGWPQDGIIVTKVLWISIFF